MCRHQAGLENEPVLCSQRPENDPVCFLVTLGEPKNKRTLFQWVARPAPWARTIAYCESDPYCQAVLFERMAKGDLDMAPIWPDVRTASDKPESVHQTTLPSSDHCSSVCEAGVVVPEAVPDAVPDALPLRPCVRLR